MYSSVDIDNIQKIILSKIPDTDSIYLFGSYAKGTARDDSDIDIAVLLKRLPDWRERKRILNQVYNEAGESGYNVDFIIKSKDSFESEKTLPTLSRIIEREGRLLWTKK
ncbi:MAG TPA: nucleotidyltransferase domain-containing protein [Spirochaetota bacterium]|nr:nucleotidyltransferase domain-containing protein [Spirochaetota bacterium]